ncbi:MAG: site-specific DNA-methyltransferase, partial [Deltaproteobacteria bacterium]
MDPSAPRLWWPGRPAEPLCVEASRPSVTERWGEGTPAGTVLLGENLGLLAGLEPGSVDLAYLDPPFYSGERYHFRTTAGGRRFEVGAFADQWPSLGAYLAFLEDRLRLVARALSPRGSLYLHLDAQAAHYAKVLADEVLGAAHFSRQIVWRIGWVSGFKARAKNWVRNHDVLLYYARPGAPFERILLPHPEGYARRGGGEGQGRPLDDVWVDLPSIQIMSYSGEKTGYGTQKNLALLERIVRASSRPGDRVLDPFAGAGTAAVAAHRLGRRFVVIDASPLAVHLTRRRLVAEEAVFTVAEETPSTTAPPGPLRVRVVDRAEGPALCLEGAPEAAGPEGTSELERIDAWWVYDGEERPARPRFVALRPTGRRGGSVPR